MPQDLTLTQRSSAGGFFRRAEAFLDARGKGAWIASMVIGFILFWPVGLALLFYMIWGKKMFGKTCATNSSRMMQGGLAPTGNSAFDAYKADTLRRLEEEQRAFEGFLDRLRAAKDQAEFDQFMAESTAKPKAKPAPEAEG